MRHFISLMYHNVVKEGHAFPDLSPSVTSYFVGEQSFHRQMQSVHESSDCCALSEVRAFYSMRGPDSREAPFSVRPKVFTHPGRGAVCPMGGHGQDRLPTQRMTASSGKEAGRIPVHISFDDGWLGTIDVAGPILETFGLSATLFVTTDLIGRSDFVDRTTIQQLPPEFTLGSHARSHRLLNQLEDRDIREELQTSKQELENLVGYEIDTLSIPGGAYDARVRRIAREEGYRMVFTSDIRVNSHKDDPFAIGRIAIRENTLDDRFHLYLSGDVRHERRKQRLIRSVKRFLRPTPYECLRRLLLGEERNQHDMVQLTRRRAL